ncbi:hypothetical protein, partial [Rhodohalobacter sp.]|uniref:hypothetical protein n=1 Tax=Rhodohalobacter sp. TaxID=1974210 RepID=UPI003563B2B7
MKKISSLIIALFVFGIINSYGQAITADINANANVVQSLTLNAGDDLSFGDVIAGNNGTIEIDGTDGSAIVSNASVGQLGTFTFDGTAGAEYAISFSIPTELTGATSTLPFGMNGLDYGRVEDAAVGSGNFNPTNGVDIQLDDDGSGAG